jgi:hypothetical protein
MVLTAIPFGAFAPDTVPLDSNALRQADGVVPVDNGYAPIRQFQAETGLTLPATCRGAASYVSPTGGVDTFAATATTIYRRMPSTFQSVGSGYLASEYGWRFEQFGAQVIATNGVDPVQKYDQTVPGSFVALGGSPPRARYVCVVRDFVLLAHLNGNGLLLQWSGINDAESWSPTVNLSDYQALPVGGAITGVVGGEYAVIFQEDRISRMTFTGGPEVFRFDEISTGLGCRIPNSVVQEGRRTYFYSPRGFMVCDGANVSPIGNEMVDRYFDGLQQKKYHYGMTAALDPVRKLVVWTIPDKAVPDKWLIYNYSIGRWSTHTQSAEMLLTGRTRDIMVDEDSGETGDADLDTAGLPSLDSDVYRGGDPTFYVFDGSHAFGAMTGSNAAATISTGDFEPFAGKRARLWRVMPQVDAQAGMTVTIEGRARHGDTLTAESFTTLQASGWMPVRCNWRTIRPRLAIAAGTAWSYARGIALEYEEGGTR